MDAFDFLVFFFYVIIFYVLISIRSKKYTDLRLRTYNKIGFWVKVVSSFAYCMFVIYISPGDTTVLYFPEGYNIYSLILKDFSNLRLLYIPSHEFDQGLLANIGNSGYLNEESNFIITKIAAFFCFFTFGKFMAVNLFFSIISYTGVWRLFLFFYEQYPKMHKQLCIALLILPTFVFWSSGILKDPLCTGALGWLTYALYSVFYKKKHVIKYAAIALVSAYMLVVLKVYIIVSYIPFFALFIILQNVTLIRNKLLKVVVVLAFILVSLFSFITITDTMQQAMGKFVGNSITESIKNYQVNYESQSYVAESNFTLGVEFDGSASSLLRIAPAAIVATLFRPFIWETKKISTLLSALESLAFILFTLYVIFKVGPKRIIQIIVLRPIVLYCLFFSLLFSLFVGATTLNFGTLVRYKIPGLPFYLISLFFLLYFNDLLKKRPDINQATVSKSN